MNRTRRTIVLAGLVVALASTHRRAEACSCVEWPPEKRMADASQVFLGRYLRPGPDGDGSKLRFEVLDSLKGEVGHTFELPRQSELECERSFTDRELALVLVVKGRIPICAGNFDLDKLMPTLGEYFALSGHASPAPTMDAIKVALAGKLGHARKLTMYAPQLAGKAVQVGATKISFVDSRGEVLPALSGATSGSVSYVVLRTPDSIATWSLIAPARGHLSIAYELKRDLKIR